MEGLFGEGEEGYLRLDHGTAEGADYGVVGFVYFKHVGGRGDIANVDLDAVRANEFDVGGF